MINFDVSRVYLTRGQVTSFHFTVGTGYWYMLQNIGTGDPDYRLKGYVTPKPVDVTGFRMWCRPSSHSDDLRFKVHVIRQKKTSGSRVVENQVFKSEEFQPKTLDSFLISFDIDDMSTNEGDIVSIAFERIGTGGIGTYLLYPDSTSVVTREP